jgi:hypothetical protein
MICLPITFHLLPLHAQDAGNQQVTEATDTTDTSTAESELIWAERAHTLIIAMHGIIGTAD